MKPVSNDHLTYILKGRRFAMAELYTFTLVDGSIDRFTNLDFDLTYGGNVFKGNSIIIEGLNMQYSPGWTAGEQDVKIIVHPEDTMAGGIFIQNLTEGLLDGATILRQRAFWRAQETVAMMDMTHAPTDVLTLFIGNVSTIDKIGRTIVELKVASPLKILDIDMPRNTYQPECQWSLFDQGCGLSRSGYVFTGSVETSLTGDWGFEWSGGVLNPLGDDDNPYYMLGRLHFTSGANSGLTVSVRTNDDNNIYYMYPPINGVAVGDTFEIWPGCAKTINACGYKFGNLPRFRGFARVPPIFVSA